MSGPDMDTSPPHQVVIVPPPGHQQRRPLLEQCIGVRIDVFVHEQRFPLDLEVDEQDPTATHFLLRLVPSLKPIGTIRAHAVEGANHYKLSRLAVLEPYRRLRLGRELVLALHQWARVDAMQARAWPAVRIVCHSQLPVRTFYSKYGYQPEGDEFDEDGAPHQKMVACLSP